MTVYELLNLCMDASLMDVQLYDLNSREVIWSGFGDEVPENYEDVEVDSYDPVDNRGTFTINISI